MEERMLEEIVRERQAYQKLRDAVMECDYPVLYECLRKEKGMFLHEQAYDLCVSAIQNGCTLECFRAILTRCVPLEEFIYYQTFNYVTPHGIGGLLEEAAAWNCGDILEYLISLGFSPNARADSYCSALEAALWHGAADSVSVLLKQGDVDFSVTERILEIWGTLGMGEERDACFRAVAGRLLENVEASCWDEIPLLPGLTVLHAAQKENWELVLRLCRETEVTEKQGKRVLERYACSNWNLMAFPCGELLEALFSACPQLLRCELPRYLLTVCILCGDEETAERLRPWVEKIPGREIVLVGWKLGADDSRLTERLSLWEERMGSRFRPVLRRDRLLPVRQNWDWTWDQIIRKLLSCCKIRGSAPAGKVSRLAEDVLQTASAELIGELCGREILFSQEDWDALLESCEDLQEGQTKRNALMAYRKKNVSYDL